MAPDLELFAIRGIGEIAEGDDLAEAIGAAIAARMETLEGGDVVVVTHKIVSKAEGRIQPLDNAAQAVADESIDIIRRRGDLIIARTRHGFICANAGVDKSNVPDGNIVLLPIDPDRSARGLRARLEERFEVPLAVVVTDTFGRTWRRGLMDVAIGISGIPALVDYRGLPDHTGRVMEVTEVAVVDEVAAAADLVMGKAEMIPVAVVRGISVPISSAESAKATDLIRESAEDLFL